MKKFFIYSVLSLLLLSCTSYKKPIFLGIESIHVQSISKDSIKLSSKALFKNENSFGGKISTDNINVFIDENPVAKVKFKKVKVPAKSKFEVPLNFVIPFDKVSKNGILNSLLNSFLQKKINLKIKGNINYRIAGFKKSYPINKTEEINLTKL